MGISGIQSECDIGKHILMNSSVNCALSNKLCSWEYLVILLKWFTVKIKSYCCNKIVMEFEVWLKNYLHHAFMTEGTKQIKLPKSNYSTYSAWGIISNEYLMVQCLFFVFSHTNSKCKITFFLNDIRSTISHPEIYCFQICLNDVLSDFNRWLNAGNLC